MKGQRVEYIDALRGFTMILVVFAHVETFMLQIDPGRTIISSLFLSFRMPLFFFISGYISYKKQDIWNKEFYIRSIAKKIRIQLMPTLFFGLLYTYLFSVGDICGFLYNSNKYGYWFTLSLLGMFAILYLNNFLISCNKKRSELLMKISLILIAFTLFLFRFIYDKYSVIRTISDVFCFHQICVYFPFFVFGYIASMHKEIFTKFLDNKKMQLCVFIIYIITFYIQRTLLITETYDHNLLFILYRSIQYIIIGCTGICVVYNFFRLNSDLFSSKSAIGMLLQTIGRRTLEIYVLHYFFLSPMPFLGNFKENTSNIMIELLSCVIISMIIIYCSLFVAKILRLSNTLSYYFLGVSRK